MTQVIQPRAGVGSTDGWRSWQDAWDAALYGPDGFYRRPEGPAGHFRTASHAAAAHLAAAMASLAQAHGCGTVLEIGAGRGELLVALSRYAPHLRLHGVDVVGRPPALPAGIGWSTGLTSVPEHVRADVLVLAWELLDVVACPVLEVDDDRAPRVVQVEPTYGRERLGPPAPPDDVSWCERWWPLDDAEPGERREVGSPREALWHSIVAGTRDAVLLMVDYAHTLGERPPLGSLSGFRAGRQVVPVPDGRCDITAEVAVDAVAAAGERAGATTIALTTQAAALADLGACGPGTSDLLDPGSWGSFAWLVQQTR